MLENNYISFSILWIIEMNTSQDHNTKIIMTEQKKKLKGTNRKFPNKKTA